MFILLIEVDKIFIFLNIQAEVKKLRFTKRKFKNFTLQNNGMFKNVPNN